MLANETIELSPKAMNKVRFSLHFHITTVNQYEKVHIISFYYLNRQNFQLSRIKSKAFHLHLSTNKLFYWSY